MTQTEKQKMMLTAPVEGLICRMAVPTMISMLITALYNMADTYFVGKLGSNAATGAVGVALPLMAIIQATGFFFGHGSGNSISRHLGAGDVEDAEKLAKARVRISLSLDPLYPIPAQTSTGWTRTAAAAKK